MNRKSFLKSLLALSLSPLVTPLEKYLSVKSPMPITPNLFNELNFIIADYYLPGIIAKYGNENYTLLLEDL